MMVKWHNAVLAALILVFGTVFVTFTVRAGAADSALLFVVLPTVLAAVLALTPGRTGHSRVFRFTTIGLLLTAVALHEGAICVLLTAPLVYGVVHATVFTIQLLRRHSRILPALVPLPMLLAGVEGVQPQWRIEPDQSVEASRIVPAQAGELPVLLGAGPQPTGMRPLSLRLLGVAPPEHVHGAGLGPGDRWTFGFHGSSHGPGGQIVTEVTTATAQEITFAVVEDSSITGRWVRLSDATLSWRPVTGGTEVTVRIDYRRGLDPSWYFGPIQDRLMHAGAEHLLDMLALS